MHFLKFFFRIFGGKKKKSLLDNILENQNDTHVLEEYESLNGNKFKYTVEKSKNGKFQNYVFQFLLNLNGKKVFLVFNENSIGTPFNINGIPVTLKHFVRSFHDSHRKHKKYLDSGCYGFFRKSNNVYDPEIDFSGLNDLIEYNNYLKIVHSFIDQFIERYNKAKTSSEFYYNALQTIKTLDFEEKILRNSNFGSYDFDKFIDIAVCSTILKKQINGGSLKSFMEKSLKIS